MAWHAAQPPAKNIVFPFSALTACVPSAAASTVFGAVTNQNAAAPSNDQNQNGSFRIGLAASAFLQTKKGGGSLPPFDDEYQFLTR